MNIQDKINEFYEYRKAIKKPIKEASKKAFISRLEKLGKGNEFYMIEILEQSIANGWQGIFELKIIPDFQTKAIDLTQQANEVFNQWESEHGNSKNRLNQ